MLTPEEAAPILGVPAAQLARWAWDRVGPKNSGTRYKPRYREEDLREWADQKLAYLTKVFGMQCPT